MSRSLTRYSDSLPALPAASKVLANIRPDPLELYRESKSVFIELYVEENSALYEHLMSIAGGLEGHYHQIEIAGLIKARGEEKGIRILVQAPKIEIARKVNFVRLHSDTQLSLSYRRCQARLASQAEH